MVRRLQSIETEGERRFGILRGGRKREVLSSTCVPRTSRACRSARFAFSNCAFYMFRAREGVACDAQAWLMRTVRSLTTMDGGGGVLAVAADYVLVGKNKSSSWRVAKRPDTLRSDKRVSTLLV